MNWKAIICRIVGHRWGQVRSLHSRGVLLFYYRRCRRCGVMVNATAEQDAA